MKKVYIKNGIDKSLKLGNISSKGAISILFYIGLLVILKKAIHYGKVFFYTNNIVNQVWDKSSTKMFKTDTIVQQKTYMVEGIFKGVLYFLIAAIIWKVVCELVLKIFRCFEVYVDKNKVE